MGKSSAGSRSGLASLIESLTRKGLSLGIPVAAVSAAYLLFIVFGPKLHMLSAMSPADRAYLHATVESAIQILRISSIVVVASLALRLFFEPLAGQVMALVGAALYFLSPAAFLAATSGALVKVQTYQEIVAEFSRLGFVALMPGGLMIARDIGSRIANRIAANRASAILRSAGDPRAQRVRRRKLYEKCWDMPLCREFLREHCPAWERRKTCWRTKCGCICESDAASKAMAAGSTDERFVRLLLKGMEDDRRQTNELSVGQKRIRCRRCVIYAEHQRQKYRILSALVFPAVALAFYLNYGWLSATAWTLLERTDRFLSWMAYNPGEASSFASQGNVLTTLALIWLGIVVLSYALRIVEYLIFDLQV